MSEAGQSRTPSAIMSALHWAYDQATSSIPGLGDAEDVAKAHLVKCGGSTERAIDDLILRHVGYAGAAGFVTNLGGFTTMPVAVPANLASVLFIQLRLIAAIAILRGYRVSDQRVRTLTFLCLVGSAAADLLEELSTGLGTKLSTHLITRISARSLMKINEAVGFKLVARAGQAGIVNLARIVPFVGGLVGGGFDALVTRGIGTAAKITFRPLPAGHAADDATPSPAPATFDQSTIAKPARSGRRIDRGHPEIP
jgi:hypothetical protein